MSKIKVNIRLPDELFSRLQSAAEYHDLSYSEIYRKAFIAMSKRGVGCLQNIKPPTVREDRRTEAFSNFATFFIDPEYVEKYGGDNALSRAVLSWYLANFDKRETTRIKRPERLGVDYELEVEHV